MWVLYTVVLSCQTFWIADNIQKVSISLIKDGENCRYIENYNFACCFV